MDMPPAIHAYLPTFIFFDLYYDELLVTLPTTCNSTKYQLYQLDGKGGDEGHQKYL
jgi:hypothetical protein